MPHPIECIPDAMFGLTERLAFAGSEFCDIGSKQCQLIEKATMSGATVSKKSVPVYRD